MAAIDQIINIAISQQTTAVATTSTTIPLIVGSSTPSKWNQGELVRAYYAPADMLADGFADDSPEYIAAQALVSQKIVPASFLVGIQSPDADSIGDSLAAISAQNNSWYGLLLPGASDEEILSAAKSIESQRKILIAASATAGIGDSSSTSDVGAELKSGSYSRTALIFSPKSAAAGIDAGWMGGFLPDVPGSYNTAYMTINGVAADVLTAGQQAACIGSPVAGTQGKNVNIYQTIQGIGVTQMGTMASGQFIDITVGVDALYFALQTAIFSDLINNKKIPYTNRGVAILVAGVRGVLEQQIAVGLIDGAQDYSVSAPAVSTVPRAQRAGRIAPTISFYCVVQGAVNAVRVTGQISI